MKWNSGRMRLVVALAFVTAFLLAFIAEEMEMSTSRKNLKVSNIEIRVSMLNGDPPTDEQWKRLCADVDELCRRDRKSMLLRMWSFIIPIVVFISGFWAAGEKNRQPSKQSQNEAADGDAASP